ncbi:MAG: hypothetical protein AAGB26_17045 [Planctomycetota bacterium]
MNRLITILTLLALTLPVSAIAQPEDDERTPRERVRERMEQRERERQRDGDRPGRPDRDRDRDREPLTEEQVADALATLKDMHAEPYPRWLTGIEALAAESPEDAAQRLSRFPRIRELMDMRENRPEEFGLHTSQAKTMRSVFPLIKEIHEAQEAEDQDKVDMLKTDLRDRMTQLFEIRLEIKAIEIQRKREQLAKEDDRIQELRSNRDALIDEKMQEMLTGTAGPRGPHKDLERGDRTERPDRSDRADRPERKRPKPDPEDRPERE